MALPPAIRYRLVRLQAVSRPLRRPAVWGILAALGLGAVVVPQYLRHPEWRSRYNGSTESPTLTPGTDLGALSSEDLADLAEIDNLALLLNQLQPTTATALEQPAAPDRLALPPATVQPPPPGSTETSPASPFAQYLERHRFRFSPSVEAGTEPAAGQRPGLSPATPTALPPSPLQQALAERLSGSSSPASSANPVGVPRAEASAPGEEAPSGLTPLPWMVEGSLPGVDQRFIRTTPQMSPPPGTTGYTPPAAIAPAPGVTAPQTEAIAPAGLNLDFGAPVTAPAGSVEVRSPAGSPGTLPSITLPPQPVPPPFSAPRPPGVYTGNGYINTFADPSGPPN
ncbi:hypothetical protein [Leptolyngbya sp. KIOST-1]|uniref:hypothetical protein n=1 Tax=Leptolyngbya sp. KIOST-1 TaxID=1229172 RepID=UPI00056889B0|nr:hypothetical protein [Leptolyngbya sp. KIOST-1]